MSNDDQIVGRWIAVCATLFFIGLTLVLFEQVQVGGLFLALWALCLMGLGWTDHQFTQRRRAQRQARRD